MKRVRQRSTCNAVLRKRAFRGVSSRSLRAARGSLVELLTRGGGKHMRRCPTCSSLTEKVWESVGGINGGSWWTGVYKCEHCGTIRASGTERDGVRRVVQWSPGCPKHGTEPVYLVTLDEQKGEVEWVCSTCHRRMRVEDDKLIVTWTPRPAYQPVFLDTSRVDQAIERLGGLPHD